MSESVNHPEHYNNHPSGIECIDVVEHMGFNLGSAVKYLWRCDHKKDAIEDLKKAIWLIQREIAKREKEANSPPTETVTGGIVHFKSPEGSYVMQSDSVSGGLSGTTVDGAKVVNGIVTQPTETVTQGKLSPEFPPYGLDITGKRYYFKIEFLGRCDKNQNQLVLDSSWFDDRSHYFGEHHGAIITVTVPNATFCFQSATEAESKISCHVYKDKYGIFWACYV